MIEMHLGTLVGNPDEGGAVTLRERDGERSLTLTLAPNRVLTILSALGLVSRQQPSIHHLLTTVTEKLGSRIERVVIHDLRDGKLIATLEVRTENGVIELECGAGDALATAAQAGCPVEVDETLIEGLGQHVDAARGPCPPTAWD